MKFAKLGFAILLVTPFAVAAVPHQDSWGQNTTGQQETLADAAKRAQAEKKNQAKAPKVWDNDSIPDVPGNVNVVGPSSGGENPPAGDQGAKPQDNSQNAKPRDKGLVEADLAQARADLDSLKGDLDIAQRKYALDEQTYISDPNHEHNKDGAAALEDEKDEIAAKQQQIADAEKKIDDLQTQLSAAANSESK
jgi:hypothetical protein